jgi:hypothetical protein
MSYSSISVIRPSRTTHFCIHSFRNGFPVAFTCPWFITDHYDGVVLRHEFPRMIRCHRQVPKNSLEELPYTVPADVDAFRRARVGANICPAQIGMHRFEQPIQVTVSGRGRQKIPEKSQKNIEKIDKRGVTPPEACSVITLRPQRGRFLFVQLCSKRLWRDMTQQQVADAAGAKRGVIQEWEAATHVPRAAQAVKRFECWISASRTSSTTSGLRGSRE